MISTVKAGWSKNLIALISKVVFVSGENEEKELQPLSGELYLFFGTIN
jgi:hypothetical protein